MKVNEAITRGYTFFVVAVLGILGGSVVTELAAEDEWLHRLDELLLIAIGVVAIVWYLAGHNRVQRSLVPPDPRVGGVGSQDPRSGAGVE